MNGIVKSVYLAGSAVCLLIASGCVVMSRAHNVSEVRFYPKTEIHPAICIGSTTYVLCIYGVNNPGTGSIDDKLIPALLHASFEKSGLFSNVSNSESSSDYRVDFEATKDIKRTGGSISLTHATLGLIPNNTRRTYTWTAHIKNLKTGEVRSVYVEEGGDGFEHLLCLPFFVFCGAGPVEIGIDNDLSQNIAVAVHEAISKWGQVGPAVSREATMAAPKVEPKTVEDGLVKKLKALKDAREAGVLTEQEYQTKRAEALKGL